MSAVQYCDFGDLPTDVCACQKCRPDVDDALLDGGLSVVAGRGALLDMPVFEPVGRRFEAAYPGTCANDACGRNFSAGSMIARSSEGYVCSGCAA